jgi:hypothetical protein
VKKVSIITITALVLLAGCGGNGEPQNGPNTSTGQARSETRFEATGPAAFFLRTQTTSKLPELLEQLPCGDRARMVRLRNRGAQALETPKARRFLRRQKPADVRRLKKVIGAELTLIDQWLRYCEEGGS